VDRARNNSNDFDADKHVSAVRRETTRIVHPNFTFEKTVQEIKETAPIELPKATEKPVIQMEPVELTGAIAAGEKKVQKSFFDEIG